MVKLVHVFAVCSNPLSEWVGFFYMSRSLVLIVKLVHVLTVCFYPLRVNR